MTDLWKVMSTRAAEYLAAARSSYGAKLYNVAFEEARTAAELAAKARLQRSTGQYPKRDHNPTGELQRHRLLPPGVSAPALSRLLNEWTKGAYGFHEPVERTEARAAIELAEHMMKGL